MSFPGEEIRGPQIPRRQQPEDVDLVTQYAIQMIPINGKPYAVDESMWIEDPSGLDNDMNQDRNDI